MQNTMQIGACLNIKKLKIMHSFGNKYKITVFGESHGKAIGVTIDGCIPGIQIDNEMFALYLNRRKAGKEGTTNRIEIDKPEIISGVYNGKSTGAPITILVKNTNIQSNDYDDIKHHFRPGHADFSAQKKYQGYNDHRGGGFFSGRMTIALVIAGVIAKKMIPQINISAKLIQAGGSEDIQQAVQNAIDKNDSIGGIIECTIKNIDAGIGNPFFDSIESVLSHLIFSIPGIRGIEFGSGFASASMLGSQCNDLLINQQGKTKTNHSGGINGGISNGNDIVFRVAVKPTSSIKLPQSTYHFKEKQIKPLTIKGRHDSCFALRMPVIIEAAAAIVLADFLI